MSIFFKIVTCVKNIISFFKILKYDILLQKYLFTILFKILEKNNYYYIVFYNYILLKLWDNNFYYFLNPKQVNNYKRLFESKFFLFKKIYNFRF